MKDNKLTKLFHILKIFFTLYKLLFLFVVFLGIKSVLLAEELELSLKDVLKHIDIAETKILNIKFDFNQRINIKVTEENYKVKGEFVFQKPKKIYGLIYNEDNILQKVISDGKKLWIYSPEYNQVSIQKLEDDKLKLGLGGEFLGLGFGTSVRNLVETGKVILFKKQKDFYLLKIVSSQVDNFTITLWVSDFTWLPEKIEVETVEMLIISNILNVKINTKVKEKIFKFKMPRGVCVFDSSDFLE
ncbi:outer membrane lipoprotein carrier protein LolA [bacterium]|nr:outer membrane lipoprotein carrier protein LolA [bacterium]